MLIVSNRDVFYLSRKTWLDYSMSMQTTDDYVTYLCSDMKVKWILGNNSTVYVGVHSIDTYITYNVPRNQPDHVTNPIKKSHLLALKIYYLTTTG
jgi:hypothetical protein